MCVGWIMIKHAHNAFKNFQLFFWHILFTSNEMILTNTTYTLIEQSPE